MNSDDTPISPSRRRLARGGMALPVVLASLASKNAFAAVPYSLTISGKLSNNQSPYGPNKDPSASYELGSGKSQVEQQLKLDQTPFSSVFSSPYYANGTNETGEKLASRPVNRSWQQATLYQVLNLTKTQSAYPPFDPAFAKVAVTLYQNATAGPSDLYPLTKPQVVAMYNAVAANSSYNGTTSMGPFTWTPAQIRSYFNELYH